jgi:hypothetical protein
VSAPVKRCNRSLGQLVEHVLPFPAEIERDGCVVAVQHQQTIDPSGFRKTTSSKFPCSNVFDSIRYAPGATNLLARASAVKSTVGVTLAGEIKSFDSTTATCPAWAPASKQRNTATTVSPRTDVRGKPSSIHSLRNKTLRQAEQRGNLHHRNTCPQAFPNWRSW